MERLEAKIKLFQDAPLFPGVKRIEDYALVGLTGTKEQKIHKNRRSDVIAFWRERPDLLRKSKKRTNK